MADQEKVTERPKCDYPVLKEGDSAGPCGSEEGVSRVVHAPTPTARAKNDRVVCKKHREHVWAEPDVISIEPWTPQPISTALAPCKQGMDCRCHSYCGDRVDIPTRTHGVPCACPICSPGDWVNGKIRPAALWEK